MPDQRSPRRFKFPRFEWFRRPEPPMPMAPPVVHDLPFEGVLAAAVHETDRPHPLADALQMARDAVASTDNMGQTHDEHDLFHVIDRLSSAVVETYPESLCYEGCGRCCHYPTAFFDIFPEEWALIQKHLDTTWSPERKQTLIERFWREHGPRMWVVRLFEWLLGMSFPIFPTHQALPLACPFLEDHRCSIYEVRPFQCRTFGQFSAKLTPWSQPHVYACAAQSERLENLMAQEGPQVMLPDVAPLQLKQYTFVNGRRRVIASWLARAYPRPNTWAARWKSWKDRILGH